jgi:5-oxopent-3-ene-1,2,5-tricarboxylate decarboxylase/2-hydroxyhepta-2,4-diene-1,7-dioate isomerase
MTLPPRPSKVLAIHTNFPSRATQRGRTPSVPSYFLKPPSSLSGDGDPIVRPTGTELLTFEGEVALIIGKAARNITPESAGAHIGWLAPANDAGVADFRWADRGSNILSKGHDGFTPIGTPVEAGDLGGRPLRLLTRVNGELRQDDTTDTLLFPFELLVADLSRFITLEPGDVILTGTPAGAGVVEPGDVVEVEIEGVGSVRNPVVGAGAPTPSFGAQPRVDDEVRAQALGVAFARFKPLSADTTRILRRVATATLTVQLARLGVRDTFIRDVRPTRPDLRLLGHALTLRYVPLREDVRDAAGAGLNAQKAAVESIGPDEVLVIDARGEPGAGTIGDILAARALVRGAAGIVTDGGLRDTPTVAGLDIPVYFRNSHAAVLGLKHFPLEANVPVACGGVLVVPGDVLVGDAEGVVVVPAALAEEVARGAEEQEEQEAWALERVRAGDSTVGVFPLAEERRAEFEAWRAARQGSTGAPG